MTILFLALQAADVPAERVTLPDPTLAGFDLAKAKRKAAKPCDADDASGDIVVCAYKKQMNFVIDGARFADKPIRPSIDLPGGGRAAVSVQQVDIGGTPSRRVMVGLKLPF